MQMILSNLPVSHQRGLRAFYCDQVTAESAANVAGLSLAHFASLRRSVRNQYQDALFEATREINLAIAATAGGH